MVEQGDIFSGLVVDSVLGMQYFATDSFKDAPEGVPENVRPFVSGGYERNEEVWKVFSAVDLLEDERFLDVAGEPGGGTASQAPARVPRLPRKLGIGEPRGLAERSANDCRIGGL